MTRDARFIGYWVALTTVALLSAITAAYAREKGYTVAASVALWVIAVALCVMAATFVVVVVLALLTFWRDSSGAGE